MPARVASRGRTPPSFGIDRGFAPRARIEAAHSAKFHAVKVPTTAANWWLLRVARQLRTLKEMKSSNRSGLRRHADGSRTTFAFPCFFDDFGGFPFARDRS